MFKLYKEEIQLDESLVDTPLLQKIVEKRNKKDALAICMYVYLIAERSLDNPLRDMDEEARQSLAMRISGLINSSTLEEDVEVCARAVKEYSRLKTDKMQSDIDLYDKKMAQFVKLMSETTPQIIKNTHSLSGKVSYSTNIEIINIVLENVIKLITDKAIMVGLKRSGKFIKSLRGGLSPNSKGKTLKIKD